MRQIRNVKRPIEKPIVIINTMYVHTNRDNISYIRIICVIVVDLCINSMVKM